ncbi:MAG: NAD(P)-binding protein [Bacteroidales bacterium]|nr:NAD(P)-binding protein [Bacteroidales bacterium]
MNTGGHNKAVIIGGGLGGLFCGAILAKEGRPVLVLEKHYTAGGGLHTFKKNGQWFDTGMHYVSGFEDGGSLRKLCRYLGIWDKLSFAPLDSEAFDILQVGADGANYGFSKDCHNLHFSRLLPRTKIPNFLFSGQNLNMHGILGVPISAVITCGELIGLAYFLKKLDKVG